MILISFVPENPLSSLIVINNLMPELIIWLETEKAKNENWLIRISSNLKIKSYSIQYKEEQTLSENQRRLFDALDKVKNTTKIAYSLTAGTRMHSVFIWNLFILSKNENDLVAYVDLSKKKIRNWYKTNGELNETITDIDRMPGLSDLLGLYNLVLEKTSIKVINTSNFSLTKEWKNLKKRPNSDPGLLYEILVMEALLKKLHKSTRKKEYESIIFNAKIKEAEKHTLMAEYDVLIYSTNGEILVFECKSGKTTLKEIQAQKELTRYWGGLFNKFFAVINPQTEKAADLGIWAKKLHGWKRKGITGIALSTVFDDEILETEGCPTLKTIHI